MTISELQSHYCEANLSPMCFGDSGTKEIGRSLMELSDLLI